MKIGVIGMGFVGGTTAKVLEKVHETLPYDRYKKPYKDSSILSDAEVVFVSVPTPSKKNGEIDLSIVHDALKTLKNVKNNKSCLVIIRSTVVPGTADSLEEEYEFKTASNPEFLREKHALEDMLNTDRIVIGANRLEDYKKMEEVYKPLFPHATYIHVDRKTAEMIKYASNVMLAGQIALANEIYQVCTSFGINYDEVKKAILLDKRIARNINVPGPDGSLGFGGKCLTKDINALIDITKKNGYNPNLLEEVLKFNRRIRKN